VGAVAALAAVITLAGCAGTLGVTPATRSPASPASSGSGTAGTATSSGPSTAGTATSSSATSTTAAPSTTSASATSTRATLSAPTDTATGLDVPWSAVVLPDATVLVSERDSGQVKKVTPDGRVTIVGPVPGVAPGGEGGLLGLAVDRKTYASSPVLYAYLTTRSDNRVVRIPVDAQGRLGAPTAILTGIPRAGNHNGGRLAFGPDGFLYVTTGDAGNSADAQDRSNLGGKILRVTTDGKPAPGNPFPGSPVWSYGHRNVQGIAWDSAGRMWASEFGQNTWDELNVITPGSNYGWPTVEGAEARSGFIDPVRQWRTDDTSPSGIAVGPDGSVFLAALRGESLWKVPVNADGSTGEPQRLLRGDYGRLRDVLVGPDGNLWIVTNNTSRGTPKPGDDRVVRLPQSLTG